MKPPGAGRPARARGRGIPPLWEAASLKPAELQPDGRRPGGIPPLWEAASLKPIVRCGPVRCPSSYSASLGGGLIEASRPGSTGALWARIPPLWEAASLKPPARRDDQIAADARIPPLWEAASLKQRRRGAGESRDRRYSASLGGGLIEARGRPRRPPPARRYSASLGGGLIEACASRAPASRRGGGAYSASLGGGLIEASVGPQGHHGQAAGIPPLWEAASLKPARSSPTCQARSRIPPLWEAASLKRVERRGARAATLAPYSASLGGGLIEASSTTRASPPPRVFRLFGRRPH